MAIVRKPGSSVPDGVKSKALEGLLRQTREASSRLVTSLAPLDGQVGWVRAAAQEAAVTMVASQWEGSPDSVPMPVDEHLEALEDLFRVAGEQPDLREAIDDLGAARYVEATDPAIAASRVSLSARMALWDLLAWVNHPSLGSGTQRYRYDRAATQIVELMAPEVMAIAREANIRIDSLDLRTTHLQSSLRRVADLMGAEYVSRTRALMDWIAEKGIDEAEYKRRYEASNAQFEERVLPDLVEWTRRNFRAVESMATRLNEDTDERQERPSPRN
jgi:hypothetical protein